MNEKHNFQWANKDYETNLPMGVKWWEEFVVVLPNRTVLRINGSYHPSKREIFHPFQHASVGEIAEHFNACLAQESI